MSEVVGLPSNSYKPITNTAWVRSQLCKWSSLPVACPCSVVLSGFLHH